MDRNKLNTVIEREVHTLVRDIREHVYDFVHLYMRKNGLEGLDKQTVEKVLEVVKIAINDGELSKIELFHSRVSAALGEEMIPKGEEAVTPKTSTPDSPPKRVSLSI